MSYVFSGLMATIVRRKRISEQGLSAAMWVIIFPVMMDVILIVYQGMSFGDATTWLMLVCGFTGALFSFLLTIGLHPYIELMVNDDSVIVLNELSNPNHPLLKQLLEEAPGTYHHSMMVANLSANAVAEIGGRSLLTRVACYYHDIGKIKHASFFVENLPSGAENPHNLRAMDHPTSEKIESFVHNLIEERISDGQLDDSGLTLKEIRKVEKSLISGLSSTFHSRIKYPKMKTEVEKIKEEQEE